MTDGVVTPLRHAPAELRNGASEDVRALVEVARSGKLVLYLGAGVSIPAPACGPRGNEVADRLRPIVAELLGVAEDEVTETTLEELAGRVAEHSPAQLERLKTRAADVWDFREMLPNYAHEIIALLLREGLVRVVSANWDCGVENAGMDAGVRIEGVSSRQERLALGANALAVLKVHGCARKPGTLVLTRQEVDAPATWARAEVETALSGGVVVFVGLGTVGLYVSDSVEELASLWVVTGTTVRVVDLHGPSDAWAQALGDRLDDTAVEMGADEFFDELARALVDEALSRVEQDARQLHATEGATWSEATLAGCGALRAALGNSHADAVLRWWRDGVAAELHGHQFVTDPAGRAAVLCVAQLVGTDGGAVEVAGTDGDLTVRSPNGYHEIACQPGALRRDVERRARTRIDRRRRNGRYEAGVPVLVSIHGARGSFPALDAKPDIAAAEPAASDIAAGDDDAVLVVRAEDALNGALAA